MWATILIAMAPKLAEGATELAAYLISLITKDPVGTQTTPEEWKKLGELYAGRTAEQGLQDAITRAGVPA